MKTDCLNFDQVLRICFEEYSGKFEENVGKFLM